jgi:N utilization substance protein B
MKRRQAREQVLRALFQRDFLGEIDPEEQPQDEYARAVLEGIEAHQAEIDLLIEERAEGWRLERLHAVDRNILRLAIYELLYRDDVPPEVAIDEAVELAKKYGTERSPAFINGILDHIYKERSAVSGQRKAESC